MKTLCSCLLLACLHTSGAIAQQTSSTVTVQIYFEPLPEDSAFDSTNSQFLMAGDSIGCLINFATDTGLVSDYQILYRAVPDSQGFYILRSDVHDAITGEFLPKRSLRSHVCVVKFTDYAYVMPARPNPASAFTLMCVYIPEQSDVILDVADADGTQKLVVISKRLRRGLHALLCPCDALSSGSYVYRLTVNSRLVTTRPLIVSK